jgi:Proto-chlorophyllide reductase 57 kD subunit
VAPVEKTSIEIEWTPEALAKLKNVPFFARSQAKSRAETLAREQWSEVVTVDVIENARVKFGQ